MRKKILAVPLLGGVALLSAGCKYNVVQTAVDAAAALQGAIVAAQTQYQPTCSTDPSAQPCLLINRAVAAQNALVTATEAYCGFSTATAMTPTATCQPVSTMQAGLTSALQNANALFQEVSAAVDPATKAALKSMPKGVK